MTPTMAPIDWRARHNSYLLSLKLGGDAGTAKENGPKSEYGLAVWRGGRTRAPEAKMLVLPEFDLAVVICS